MGLDVSHDCWSGAYSAFHRWRTAIARCVGIDLEQMQGFAKEETKALVDHYRKIGSPPALVEAYAKMANSVQMPWDEVMDPLKHLLHHSDCDGSIATELCAPIADRLEAILPLLPEGEGGGHIGNWRGTTQRFIDGLRLAAERGEDVEFH
jgi:hypothetical protein